MVKICSIFFFFVQNSEHKVQKQGKSMSIQPNGQLILMMKTLTITILIMITIMVIIKKGQKMEEGKQSNSKKNKPLQQESSICYPKARENTRGPADERGEGGGTRENDLLTRETAEATDSNGEL